MSSESRRGRTGGPTGVADDDGARGARWPISRPGPPSARWSTPCWRRSTSARIGSTTELAEAVDRQLAVAVGGPDPGDSGRAPPPSREGRCWSPGCALAIETPLGAGCGRPAAGRHRCRRPARRGLLRPPAGRRTAPLPSVRGIGAVVLDHLGADDPLAGWAARLAEGAIEVTLAGHLTGSIDLVHAGPRRTGRAPVRGGRLQDQRPPPAGLPVAPDRLRPRAGWWRPWRSTTTRSRLCCTRWPSTATCGGGCPATGPTPTWVGSPTCSCGG